MLLVFNKGKTRSVLAELTNPDLWSWHPGDIKNITPPSWNKRVLYEITCVSENQYTEIKTWFDETIGKSRKYYWKLDLQVNEGRTTTTFDNHRYVIPDSLRLRIVMSTNTAAIFSLCHTAVDS